MNTLELSTEVWSLSPPRRDEVNGGEYRVLVSPGGWVGDLRGTSVAQAERNRLIVNAPQLLAALQAWANYFDELDIAGCDPSDPLTTERRKFHGKRIAATRAAIASATGTEATP